MVNSFVYRPSSPTWPTLIWTLAWSLAEINRLVIELQQLSCQSHQFRFAWKASETDRICNAPFARDVQVDHVSIVVLHLGSKSGLLAAALLNLAVHFFTGGYSSKFTPSTKFSIETGDVRLQNTVGLQNTLNNCAELYFSSHNNIARWLGVDHGRTAITVAKSNGPKINVRTFYRKSKSGSCES